MVHNTVLTSLIKLESSIIKNILDQKKFFPNSYSSSLECKGLTPVFCSCQSYTPSRNYLFQEIYIILINSDLLIAHFNAKLVNRLNVGFHKFEKSKALYC